MAEKIENEAISNAYTYRKRQYLTYLIEYLMSYKIEITGDANEYNNDKD